MRIDYPQALTKSTRYWKFGTTPIDHTAHWYNIPATLSGNTLSFSIIDGGLGDDDLDATNGVIVDPSGPGISVAASIPTLSEWGVILLAGMLGVFGMARSRLPPHAYPENKFTLLPVGYSSIVA